VSRIRDIINSLARIETRAYAEIDSANAGQSTSVSGAELDPDAAYLVVSTGPVWVRTDGGSVTVRRPPARYCDGWIVVAGVRNTITVASDTDVTSDVTVTVEGPIDDLLAEILASECGD